jgi:signal transduction histidine kinase
MKAQSLLTPAARRHVGLLLRAIDPVAGRLERRLRSVLRARRYDSTHVRAILAISLAGASRSSSLGAFFEGVEYHGRRLAKLNVELDQLCELLSLFDDEADRILASAHGPAREQLQLITTQVLQGSWYQVRESEAQVLYGLAQAEAEARDLDSLLVRIVKIVTRCFRARGGRLVLLDAPPSGKFARQHYTETPLSDWNAYAAAWSFPAGPLALIQLGFDKPYPWLPRERTLMCAVAERCGAAIERARMSAELARLEVEARHAEEEERRRIGRELHDDTAQSLLLLRLQLEMMQRDAPPAWRERLDQSRGIAERAIEDLRRTIAALSPALLERLGLESALRQLASRFAKRHSALVSVQISPLSDTLTAGAQEVVYRVAQESLQNISKHSRPNRVFLRLSSADKKFRLSVSDDGAGFDPRLAAGKPMSFGLAGMRERAALLGGTLEIRSKPGKGASIALELPHPAEGRGNDI